MPQLKFGFWRNFSTTKYPSWYRRPDFWLWFSGVIFIAILIALIQTAGYLRGWDAPSGYTYNATNTSMERFLPEPFHPEEGQKGRHSTHSPENWYYWQVKPAEKTFWTHFFPWIGYILHQVLIWATIYSAQMNKAKEPLGRGRYSFKLSRVNWVAFILNAFFHLLHFVNTHTTYDALAPDIQLFSPLTAVILFIVFVMLMEYKERGLFFGWPLPKHKDRVSTKLRLDYGPVNLVRRYHGYVFAWAAIFTFWYHPMENTVGHSLGFIYTWIMVLQGSLMYTDFHLNKYWRLLQEIWVLTHGSVVAFESKIGDPNKMLMWPMFVFGFLLAFVVTQLFGLPFWSRLPVWTRFIPLALFLTVTIWCYSWIPDPSGKAWIRMAEIIRIPAIYYLFFVLFWVLIFCLLKLSNKLGRKPLNVWKPGSRPSIAIRMTGLFAATLMIVMNMGISVMLQQVDWTNQFFVMLCVFGVLFTVTTCTACVCLQVAIPNKIVVGDGIKDDEVEMDQTVQQSDVWNLSGKAGQVKSSPGK